MPCDLVPRTFPTVSQGFCIWDCENDVTELVVKGTDNKLQATDQKSREHLQIMTDIKVGIFGVLGLIIFVIITGLLAKCWKLFKQMDDDRIHKRAMSIYRRRAALPPQPKATAPNPPEHV